VTAPRCVHPHARVRPETGRLVSIDVTDLRRRVPPGPVRSGLSRRGRSFPRLISFHVFRSGWLRALLPGEVATPHPLRKGTILMRTYIRRLKDRVKTLVAFGLGGLLMATLTPPLSADSPKAKGHRVSHVQ
jgi:hypothetical protein